VWIKAHTIVDGSSFTREYIGGVAAAYIFSGSTVYVEHCFKNQFLLLRTLGEEAFGAIAVLSKFDKFHDVRNCHPLFTACRVK